MASVAATNGTFSMRAYRGDAKTLLAFDLAKKASKDLAGFTIQVQPLGKPPFFLYNNLQFETPSDHAQQPDEPPYSTINAPLHKFRWLHVPGSAHQGLKPFYGPYTYTVTPRYFLNKSMQPLDAAKSVALTIEVAPFTKGKLALGFTRGFVQSQAFVNHFGTKVKIQPTGAPLLFDTSQDAGVNKNGDHFSYRQEYEWLGFTARQRVFALLDEVRNNPALRLDVFAYDLNEPDLCAALLSLAEQGRIRVILDSSAEHHSKTIKPKMPEEDQFEAQFVQAAAPPAAIRRGKFARFAHDKIFIVSNATGATKVLTGSTNFSITGFYVNSNHVLVFDRPDVAAFYEQVFEQVWNDQVQADPFRSSTLAAAPHPFGPPGLPDMDINVSPHAKPRSEALMDAIAARVAKEGKKAKKTGSVLFAVMGLDQGHSPVFDSLRSVHTHDDIFSYGISDSPGGIFLYRPQSTRGVLVTGRPGKTVLPKPFNQVPSVSGHQVHHKLVVCGFNGPTPVAYCGSSNLAVQGETDNGDNLIEIRDEDIVTAFAIEVVALVDHFDFLDRHASEKKKNTGGAPPEPPPADKKKAAKDAQWFLRTNGSWAKAYFDPTDLHSVDRKLFA